jgi:hypothetical protein
MIRILLVLHLLFFVFSFAFTAGSGILQARVAGTRDAGLIHRFFSMARPFSLAGGIGWIVTALLGLMVAMQAGMNLGQPWLLWSYAAFAVLILTGFLFHSPHQKKVIAASAGGPSPELDALLKSPAGPVGGLVSLLAVVALVWLMTARLG